ncbi:MAG: transposase, partial [Acidobacteriota bacterium]
MELSQWAEAGLETRDLHAPYGGSIPNRPTPAVLLVAERTAVYRPRHPEQTAFYQLLEQHFDDYVYAYEERFEPKTGPLRAVVRPTVEAFLDCGRLHGGFARIRCPSCRNEHLLAFSCQTRNFCASCQAKRSVLFAEKLREQILQPVAHRHYVFTIPKALRGLFERERPLLSLLSQTAYESIRESFQELFQRKDVRPGAVSSIQTFGSFAANFHPHIHSLITEGVVTPEGEFLPLAVPATSLLADIEERFRRLLLRRLNRAERLSEGFLNKLLGWNPSGFSVYANQLVFDDEPERLERLARYLTRAPLGVDTVRTNDDGQVEVSTPPLPRTANTVLRLDPLDCIHSICQQIPDRGQHLTRYYGAYANRARRAAFPHEASKTPPSSSGPQPEPDSDS